MEFCDVSNEIRFLAILRDQRRKLETAKTDEGLTLFVTQSRHDLITRFTLQRMVYSSATDSSTAIVPYFRPLPYAPSIASLGDLQKVMMRNLTVATHHRGYYLLVRAVTPVHTHKATMVIVEDEENNVLLLQWYNQDETFTNSCLTEGTVLLIKEPFVEIITDQDKELHVEHALRVDHLSDVIIIPNHSKFIPLQWKPQNAEIDTSAEGWKARGDKHFIQKNFHSAIEKYGTLIMWYITSN